LKKPGGKVIHIRPYKASDQSAVIDLWVQCELVKPWNNPQKDIERKLQVNPELFLVGENRGEIVATVMAGYDGHRGWVNYLAVSPDARKSGLGRELMKHVEKLFTECGCPKINLQIRHTNSQAVEFYKAIGYDVDEVIGMGKRLIPDN
jgi:ribosomal protein S18 acetylase RimI-like enzyme